MSTLDGTANCLQLTRPRRALLPRFFFGEGSDITFLGIPPSANGDVDSSPVATPFHESTTPLEDSGSPRSWVGMEEGSNRTHRCT